MGRKLINVGTGHYTVWIPAGVPVAVFGTEVAAFDDVGDLIKLRSKIVFHDGSGNSYNSPLPACQVVKLIEDSNSDFEE